MRGPTRSVTFCRPSRASRPSWRYGSSGSVSLGATMSRRILSAVCLVALVAFVPVVVVFARGGGTPGISGEVYALDDAAAAQADCAALVNLKLKDTIVTDATIVPAKGNMPEYC